MWKPTKAGTYRYGDVNREAWLSNDKLMVRDMHTNLWCPVPDGPWSLLTPDWQQGAPTVAQLSRWQWWAIWGGSGQMMVAGMVAELRLDYVLRSAPIQPDLNNGPLWVPLEVVK